MSSALLAPRPTATTPTTELIEAFHNAKVAVIGSIAPELEAQNLSPCTFWTLYRLGSGAAVHPAEIARQLGVTMPSVTASVDQLVEDGLVERQRSDDDRRLVHLTVTPAGRRVLARVTKRLDSSISRALEGLPPSDVRVAARVLAELSVRLRPAPPGARRTG
jgi:DNA-binding MarR family transcriptional regulator